MAGATRGPNGRSQGTSKEPVGASQRLGGALRAVRITSGWTLEEAAERFSIDLKHLQKIEAGEQNATLATLERIGGGLGVDVGAVLAAAVAGRGTKGRGVTGVQEPPARLLPLKGAKANPVEPDDVLMSIGARVSDLRRARGLTQRELAEQARVALGFVQRMEAGRIKKLTVQRLVRVATVLQSEVAALFAPPAQTYRRAGRPNRV